MKSWFQKSPFFGLLKRNPSAQLRKTKKSAENCRRSNCLAAAHPPLRAKNGVHPRVFRFRFTRLCQQLTHPSAHWKDQCGLTRDPQHKKKRKKMQKKRKCKLVKLFWNTSLKNISFQLDHPELLETIMFEPGATCTKKTRLKYDQLHDLHHANSNVNSAFRGVMFASDFDMKIHFTWTALCLTVCIEVKFSAHFAFVCCMSWICLCKVRSSLEVDLCSKSMQEHVRLRDFSSQNARNRGMGIWISQWSGKLKLGVVIPHFLERIWVCQVDEKMHSHILVSYKH